LGITSKNDSTFCRIKKIINCPHFSNYSHTSIHLKHKPMLGEKMQLDYLPLMSSRQQGKILHISGEKEFVPNAFLIEFHSKNWDNDGEMNYDNYEKHLKSNLSTQ